MTITNITQDRRYAMPGEVVTLSATFDTGTRVRFKLLSKPFDSALELYDEAKDNYLSRGQLTPDAPGSYSVGCVEELVSANVPHFSNDIGGSALRGVETITPVPGGVLRFQVVCCDRLTRQIGAGDDVATFECIVGPSVDRVSVAIPTHWQYVPDPDPLKPGQLVADEWVYELRPASTGILTRAADRTRAPKLTSTSTMGTSAQSDAGVLLALRDLGGGDFGQATLSGYDGNGKPIFVHRAGEGEIIPWEAAIDAAPLDTFRRTVEAFNGHIQSANNLRVHNAADNVNAAPALAGASIAQQAAFLDGMLATLIAHAGNAAHPTADTILSTVLSALAPLGVTPSLDALCARTNLVFDLLDDHLVRLYLPGVTPQVHLQMASNRLDASLYPRAVDAATSYTRCGAIKSRYDSHRVEVQPYSGGVYHASAATSAEQYTDALPEDRDSFVSAVGTLMTCVVNHLQNMSAAGVATAYHAQPDHGSVLAAIRSKPSDFASAVTTLEILRFAIARHSHKGSPTHAIQWAGAARPAVRGLEALNHAWLTATSETTAPIGANMVYASGKLAQWGGFKVSP